MRDFQQVVDEQSICDGVCPENYTTTYHRLNQSWCAIAPINMYEKYGDFYCRWCYPDPHIRDDNLREITLGDHFRLQTLEQRIKCEKCNAELFTPQLSVKCKECITHSVKVIDDKIQMREIFGARGRVHTPTPIRPLSDRP